jgi:pimeloyl-ACP methyl ester carboxylesterase
MRGSRVIGADEQFSGSSDTGKERLAILGRPVQGVAADGVTQVLVRIPAAQEGETFRLEVIGSADENGALTSPGEGIPAVNLPTFATAVATNNGPFAFAVYRAPGDFPRENGQDAGASSRTVSINVQHGGSNFNIPITIVRPPVVLIHGLWSSWKTWKDFSPLVAGANNTDSRFSILRVNYDTLVGPQVTQSNPIYFIDRLREVKANSLGFSYNAPNVLSQMSQWLQGFRMGNNGNPAHVPVAAAQFDVVAHSMGGNIIRTMPLLRNYLNYSNFGQGFIHKVITIDTPHQGSPVPSVILDASNGCTRRWLASKAGLFAFSSVTVAGATTTGAVGDLRSGSPAIQAIQGQLPDIIPPNTPPVPTALIAGIYTNWGVLDIGPDIATELTIKSACRHDTAVTSLTSSGWPRVFAPDSDPQGQRNDTLVGVDSQLDGLGDPAGSIYTGFVHTSAFTGAFGLGFISPSVLDANTAISSRVVDLLNTAVTDSAFKRLGPNSQ